MNDYWLQYTSIECDIKENNLYVVDGWSAEELSRIFDLESEEEIIGHAIQKRSLS